jgi:hypothetical protein
MLILTLVLCGGVALLVLGVRVWAERPAVPLPNLRFDLLRQALRMGGPVDAAA